MSDLPALSARIRKAIRCAGGKGPVAAKTGISDRTLGYLLAGQDAKLSQLERIAKATGVSLSWLATGEDPNRRDTASNAVEISLHLAPGTAAGPAGEPGAIPYIGLALPWLQQTLRRDARHLRLFQARGDAMAPTILDGDVLMLDLAAGTTPNYGRIYAISAAGDVVLRRIHRRVHGGLIMLCDNPRYPSEEFEPGHASPQLLGEAVWHARPL